MEWPKIITNKAPEKQEFKVFDNLQSCKGYRRLREGQNYNHEMYSEALKEFKKYGAWIKYNDWFDD